MNVLSCKNCQMKKLVILLTFCISGCNHLADTHLKQVRQLEKAYSFGEINTVRYLRERIKLDAQNGITKSIKWHDAMLRYTYLENTYDPMRHGNHFKLIEDAKVAGEITEIQYTELRQLADKTRQARSTRQKKRRMDRFKLGYR